MRVLPTEVAQLEDVTEDQFDVLATQDGAVGHGSRFTWAIEHRVDDVQRSLVVALRGQQFTGD